MSSTPLIEEVKAVYSGILPNTMNVGDAWCVVSTTWLAKWKLYTSYDEIIQFLQDQERNTIPLMERLKCMERINSIDFKEQLYPGVIDNSNLVIHYLENDMQYPCSNAFGCDCCNHKHTYVNTSNMFPKCSIVTPPFNVSDYPTSGDNHILVPNTFELKRCMQMGIDYVTLPYDTYTQLVSKYGECYNKLDPMDATVETKPCRNAIDSLIRYVVSVNENPLDNRIELYPLKIHFYITGSSGNGNVVADENVEEEKDVIAAKNLSYMDEYAMKGGCVHALLVPKSTTVRLLSNHVYNMISSLKAELELKSAGTEKDNGLALQHDNRIWSRVLPTVGHTEEEQTHADNIQALLKEFNMNEKHHSCYMYNKTNASDIVDESNGALIHTEIGFQYTREHCEVDMDGMDEQRIDSSVSALSNSDTKCTISDTESANETKASYFRLLCAADQNRCLEELTGYNDNISLELLLELRVSIDFRRKDRLVDSSDNPSVTNNGFKSKTIPLLQHSRLHPLFQNVLYNTMKNNMEWFLMNYYKNKHSSITSMNCKGKETMHAYKQWGRHDWVHGWKYHLNVGDEIEVCDNESKWCACWVVEVGQQAPDQQTLVTLGERKLPLGAIKVQFRGWDSKFNKIVLSRDIEKCVCPLFTHTTCWRNRSFLEGNGHVFGYDFRGLDPGTKIEYLEVKGRNKKWYKGKIESISDMEVDSKLDKVLVYPSGDCVVQLSYTMQPSNEKVLITLPVESDLLMPLGTHIPVKSKTKSNKSTTSSKVITDVVSYNSSNNEITCKVDSFSNTYNRLKQHSSHHSMSMNNYRRGFVHIRGAVGLANLGNTCFMNSMLQCLSHIPQLTYYFLSCPKNMTTNFDFKTHINADNPLGHHGKVALAYGALMNELWSWDAGNGPHNQIASISPSHFKTIISEFAPQFAGYHQHDSQELMQFVLDGLHEDLNRVLKKPYVPAVDYKPTMSDLEYATLCWEAHIKRNQSHILDTCFGQLKSHVTCVGCGESSVAFDAYSSISLPIPLPPQKTTVTLSVVVSPLIYRRILTSEPSCCGLEMKFELQKNTTVADVKTEIRLRLQAYYKSRLESYCDSIDDNMCTISNLEADCARDHHSITNTDIGFNYVTHMNCLLHRNHLHMLGMDTYDMNHNIMDDSHVTDEISILSVNDVIGSTTHNTSVDSDSNKIGDKQMDGCREICPKLMPLLNPRTDANTMMHDNAKPSCETVMQNASNYPIIMCVAENGNNLGITTDEVLACTLVNEHSWEKKVVYAYHMESTCIVNTSANPMNNIPTASDGDITTVPNEPQHLHSANANVDMDEYIYIPYATVVDQLIYPMNGVGSSYQRQYITTPIDSSLNDNTFETSSIASIPNTRNFKMVPNSFTQYLKCPRYMTGIDLYRLIWWRQCMHMNIDLLKVCNDNNGNSRDSLTSIHMNAMNKIETLTVPINNTYCSFDNASSIDVQSISESNVTTTIDMETDIEMTSRKRKTGLLDADADADADAATQSKKHMSPKINDGNRTTGNENGLIINKNIGQDFHIPFVLYKTTHGYFYGKSVIDCNHTMLDLVELFGGIETGTVSKAGVSGFLSKFCLGVFYGSSCHVPIPITLDGYPNHGNPVELEVSMSKLLKDDTFAIVQYTNSIPTEYLHTLSIEEKERLSLPIDAVTDTEGKDGSETKSKMITLYDCLNKYSEQELLPKEETYYCHACKQHLAPKKKIELYTSPDILILQLKRFHYRGYHNNQFDTSNHTFLSRQKISNLIDFPIEGLDMNAYINFDKKHLIANECDIEKNSNEIETNISVEDDPYIYDLIGISEHSGGLGGGHYTAICKNHLNKKWYKFNDSHVSEINVNEIVTSSAYVLFYKRRHGSYRGGGITDMCMKKDETILDDGGSNNQDISVKPCTNTLVHMTHIQSIIQRDKDAQVDMQLHDVNNDIAHSHHAMTSMNNTMSNTVNINKPYIPIHDIVEEDRAYGYI